MISTAQILLLQINEGMVTVVFQEKGYGRCEYSNPNKVDYDLEGSWCCSIQICNGKVGTRGQVSRKNRAGFPKHVISNVNVMK